MKASRLPSAMLVSTLCVIARLQMSSQNVSIADSAFDLARLARRIVAVDDAHHGVVGIEAREHAAVAAFDGVLDGRAGNGVGFDRSLILSCWFDQPPGSRAARLRARYMLLRLTATCWRPSPFRRQDAGRCRSPA